MYKSLFLMLALAGFSSVAAQELEQKIAQLDATFKPVTDPAGAMYYRTVQMMPDHYLVRDYFMSGHLQTVAECSSYHPDLIKEGKSTSYYESGALLSEGMFEENKPTGLHVDYYESGKLRKEMLYEEDKRHYVQFLSETGDDLIPGGKGLVSEPVVRLNRTVYMEIENYTAVASYYINQPSDTVYTVVEAEAEYVGGLEKLAMDIRAFLRYPKHARRNGVEGKVLVQFVVDKSGRIKDSQVLRGLDPECDQEAIRTVNQLHAWIPAEHRGKEVSARFVLPINFRLR